MVHQLEVLRNAEALVERLRPVGAHFAAVAVDEAVGHVEVEV